jgi:class 3 adenylate cyclase
LAKPNVKTSCFYNCSVHFKPLKTMKRKFADALVDAQGRSEFVIVVVADIRGFSRFSTVNESPNIAMYIKRFYLQLINQYFKTANFVKPTGDGLLMTFQYNEANLLKVSETVINACLNCLNGFSTICKNDPMINFETPHAIGFGIARGIACCLYSGEEILDYSGHLLNLASRLNDLARPSGIVIDGGFLESVIPDPSRKLFKEQRVYVRSIAEESPISIYYLDKYVQISTQALSPLVGDNWQTIEERLTANQLRKMGSLIFELPQPAKAAEKVTVTMLVPERGSRGLDTIINFKNFTYSAEGPKAIVKLNIEKARELIEDGRPVTFKINFVPNTLRSDRNKWS